MKKTVSVNISNVRFVMDEDAFELLNSYLDALKASFARTSYDSDIVDDIEARIAEIFLSEIDCNSQIVNAVLVESVINRLGKPEDFIEETIAETEKSDCSETVSEEKISETPPPPFSEGKTHRHRLFRDPRNKILGGVCSGVAAYFGIDVVWVRIIFVICLFLTASTACIVYLILWVVIPEASKPLDFLELEGETPTLSNIGKTVTDTFKNGLYNDTQTSAPKKRSGINTVLSVLGKIFFAAIIIIGAPVVFALAVALIACIIAIIALGTTGSSLWFENLDFPIFSSDPVLTIIMTVAGIFISGIPLILLLLAALNTSRHKPILGKGWGIALAILWLIAFGTACIISHSGLVAFN
ncbi:MAG: PspC domain-containing protein [Muribaculaceae bacterium]|nr:PspC domain-containing protein [Muribaculaceae bacterium]